MPVSGRHTGFHYDSANGRLDVYYRGTKAGYFTASGYTGVIAGGTTVTASTDLVATAGDVKGTAGNLRLGTVNAFANTQPTSAIVMMQGTAPAGLITTSSAVFTDGTNVMKIIADSTVSNIET